MSYRNLQRVLNEVSEETYQDFLGFCPLQNLSGSNEDFIAYVAEENIEE